MKIFDVDFRKGTLIDSISGVCGSKIRTESQFNKLSKGNSLHFYGGGSIKQAGINFNYTDIEDTFKYTTGYTIVAWINGGINTTYSQSIITKRDATTQVAFDLRLENSGTLTLWSYDGTWGSVSIDASDLLKGKGDHQIIVTNNNGVVEFYIDGINIINTGGNVPIVINSRPLIVGGIGYNNGTSFVDSIYKVEMYNTIYTLKDVEIDYRIFLHSNPNIEQKTNFTKIKPTNLESEVNNTLGNDIVTNGGFDTDYSGWNLSSATASVTDGILTLNTQSYGNVSQAFSVSEGETYRVTWRSRVISGTGRVRIDATSIPTYGKLFTNTEFETFSETFVADGTGTGRVWLQGVYVGNVIEYDYVKIYKLSGLVAAYNMIPSDGKVLVDISGNGNNGTITSTLSTKDGMKFNGINSYIKTTYTGSPSEGSISCRFKYNTQSKNEILFSKFVTDHRMYLSISSLGKISGGIGKVPLSDLHGDTQLINGEEYTGTLTWDGNIINLYLNGILECSIAQDGTVADGVEAYIGAINVSGTMLVLTTQEILDIRIYNKALTVQEAIDYHNSFNKLVYRNTFKDEGADGVIKVPKTFNNISGEYSIGELSMVEINPLNTISNGTKYMECKSIGTTSFKSNQAYGTREFDIKKTNTSSYPVVKFTGNKKDGSTGYAGHFLQMYSNNNLQFYREGKNLFSTINDYIDLGVRYGFKIDRLGSAGVFKNIQTLQTDYLKNSVYSYDSFTNTTRYGFDAQKTVLASTAIGGTGEEISIIAGDKMVVEFDIKLNSGELPRVIFSQTPGVGSASALIQVPKEGKNTMIINIVSTKTNGVFTFWSKSGTVADFEIRGLTIKKIYEKGTFAVFIKGGDFGDEYTLIDANSGLNPVTDDTYRTSEWFHFYGNEGDKITNIKLNSQVQQ